MPTQKNIIAWNPYIYYEAICFFANISAHTASVLFMLYIKLTYHMIALIPDFIQDFACHNEAWLMRLHSNIHIIHNTFCVCLYVCVCLCQAIKMARQNSAQQITGTIFMVSMRTAFTIHMVSCGENHPVLLSLYRIFSNFCWNFLCFFGFVCCSSMLHLAHFISTKIGFALRIKQLFV